MRGVGCDWALPAGGGLFLPIACSRSIARSGTCGSGSDVAGAGLQRGNEYGFACFWTMQVGVAERVFVAHDKCEHAVTAGSRRPGAQPEWRYQRRLGVPVPGVQAWLWAPHGPPWRRVWGQELSLPLLSLSAHNKARWPIIVATWPTHPGVAGGATRAALTQHFALRGNAADVSAKEQSQVRAAG